MLSVWRWGYSQVSREREPFFTWRRVQSTVSRVLYLIKSELEIQMTLESSAGRRDCVQPKIWRTMYSLHSMSYRLAPTNQFSFFVLVSKQTESMSVWSLSSHIISNELYQAGCNPMPCAQNQMRRWILTIKGWRGLKASRVYVPKYQRQNCWVRRLPASPLLPIFWAKTWSRFINCVKEYFDMTHQSCRENIHEILCVTLNSLEDKFQICQSFGLTLFWVWVRGSTNVFLTGF